MDSVIYNAVLDACVGCQDVEAAEEWMGYSKQEGMTDVVSLNTSIKAQLQPGNSVKESLQPNEVTYNELANATVVKGDATNRAEVWGVVTVMQQAGVKLSRVACSSLLRCINAHPDERSVAKTMDLIGTREEATDEALLPSPVEAGMRVGRPDPRSADPAGGGEGNGKSNGALGAWRASPPTPGGFNTL